METSPWPKKLAIEAAKLLGEHYKGQLVTVVVAGVTSWLVAHVGGATAIQAIGVGLGSALIAVVAMLIWNALSGHKKLSARIDALAAASQGPTTPQTEIHEAIDQAVSKARRRQLRNQIHGFLAGANFGTITAALMPDQEPRLASEFLRLSRGELIQLDRDLLEVKVSSRLRQLLEDPFEFDDIARVRAHLLDLAKLLDGA